MLGPPNTLDIALVEKDLGHLPFIGPPDNGLAIPAPRYNPATLWGCVQRTHIVAMTDKEAVGVVCLGCRRLLDLNDGLVATGDDQTIGIGGAAVALALANSKASTSRCFKGGPL